MNSLKENQKVRSLRNKEEVSKELQGTYGKTIVVMTSNPEELDILSNKLKDDYEVVMNTEIMENKDYAKVFVRKD